MRAVAHRPHDHVHGFGHQRDEIPERVVRACRLRHLVMRLGLHGVDEVRELHRVLDEEHRDVVAHQVPVAFVGVELHGEAAHVAHGVGAAALAGHGGEAHEHRRALADGGEGRGACELGDVLGALEVAVRAGAASVDHALGNALVVEVRDLLAQDEVFEQRRPAQAQAQRVLVVGDRHALVGRDRAPAGIDAVLLQRAVVRVRAGRRLGAVLFGLVALGDGAAGGVAVLRRLGSALGGGLRFAADGVLGALVRRCTGSTRPSPRWRRPSHRSRSATARLRTSASSLLVPPPMAVAARSARLRRGCGGGLADGPDIDCFALDAPFSPAAFGRDDDAGALAGGAGTRRLLARGHADALLQG